jgi:hypothetical protein
VYYLNLILDPLNAVVVMNPIMAKNNAIGTLHLNDEECGSERFAPHGELHGDDTPGLHRVAPHVVKHYVGLHELVVLPSKVLEHGIQHQFDGSIAVDKHPVDQLLVDVAQNVQWLQVLA